MTPVRSSVWFGQKPRNASKVFRPHRNASAAAECRWVCSIRSDWSTVSSVGSNQPPVASMTPSRVMFSVTTSFLMTVLTLLREIFIGQLLGQAEGGTAAAGKVTTSVIRSCSIRSSDTAKAS